MDISFFCYTISYNVWLTFLDEIFIQYIRKFLLLLFYSVKLRSNKLLSALFKNKMQVNILGLSAIAFFLLFSVSFLLIKTESQNA